MTTIAIDGMGGDHGLNVTIPGIRKAFDALHDQTLKFALFAPKNLAEPLLRKYHLQHHVIIKDTQECISENDHPIKITQKGLKSTMGRALHYVAEKRAQAAISSGSTGGLLLLCHQYFKKIPFIDKIALPGLVPTKTGYSIMLDLGATLSATEEDLIQFALMGHVLAEKLLDIKEPTIGLLNVGKEDSKGLPNLIKAHQILKLDPSLRYSGFIEGSDICAGTVDIIVTDGFSGNIALKSMEGIADFIKTRLKDKLTGNIFKSLLSLGILMNLKAFYHLFDKRQYNGAVLLGFSQLAVKSHGHSDTIGFAHAIQNTYKLIQNNFIHNIQDYLAEKIKIKKQCIEQK